MTTPSTSPKQQNQVPTGIKLSWGSGALGVAILMNSVSFLALFYMVSILGLEPFVGGAILFATKVIDIISDPIVGRWSDSLKIEGSRRRPFMLAGAFLSAAALVMIFSTPIFENQYLTSAYIFVALSIYTVAYTLFNIPYMSMPAEMTEVYHERSAIHAYRMVFVSLGAMLAGVAAPVAAEQLGREEWSTYVILSVCGAGFILTTMLIAWRGTAKARYTNASSTPTNLVSELRHVARNKIFLRLLGIKLAQLIAAASINASLLFFVIHIMARDMNTLAMHGGAIVVTSIIASPLLVKLSQKIGKRQTYIVGATFFLFSVASWITAGPDDPVWAVPMRGIFMGVGGSAGVIMAMSMLTDIVNLDARTHGERREGIFTSLYSFVEKFSFALGPLIVGAAMSLAGFDESLPPEQLSTPAIRHALLLGVAYVPIAMSLIAIFLLRGYSLGEDEIAQTSGDGARMPAGQNTGSPASSAAS